MQTALTYSENDPNGILGPVHPEAPNLFYEGYAEYGGGPGTMNFMAWGEEFDARTRPLNQMLYGLEFGESGVSNTAPGDPGFFKGFQCTGFDMGWQAWPGWDSDPRETESSYSKANGTSFRMNNLPYENHTNSGIYGRPHQRIPAPSLTVSFLESRVFETVATNDVFGDLDHGELTSYHEKLGFFNIAYCDGHAAFADFGDGTYYQHIVWPDHPDWNFIDWRGSWGRMDCFPDPLLHDEILFTRTSNCLTPRISCARRAGS
jgi:prepilin-type processing-associated H-X9-DG protein